MNDKELAVNLLKIFGYINAKEEDVIILDSGFGYVSVDFHSLKIKFTRQDNAWVFEIEK